MVLIVKIPADHSVPLTEETVETPPTNQRGDIIPSHLQRNDDANHPDAVVDTTVLIRPSHSSHGPLESSAGLYAYALVAPRDEPDVPNVRATRLAMACGWHSKRFAGDVYVGRLGHDASCGLANVDLSAREVRWAAFGPDLRSEFWKEAMMHGGGGSEDGRVVTGTNVPDWLCAGSQKNYHDGASMRALAAAMTRTEVIDEDDGDSLSSTTVDSEEEKDNFLVEKSKTIDDGGQEIVKSPNALGIKKDVTLCLHCRRPASTLCTDCRGAYFCEEPRQCRIDGWSHQCLCPTWRLYVQRRRTLSNFAFFSGWQLPLLGEDCYRSDDVYKAFLRDTLRVINDDREDNATTTTTSAQTKLTNTNASWWNTEIHGWNGGKGASAKLVDIFQRISFCDGFVLDELLIPDENHVTSDDLQRAGIGTDENRMPILSSWEDYYRLRSLPPSSPVALLATFPLTVYYAIQRHGIVPITVSQMLDRPMKVHVVGMEKELNFIDLFREVGFLLPEVVKVDMSWIVREDMFPDAAAIGREGSDTVKNSTLLSLRLTSNLRLSVIGGTYGDSLDPNFDIIGGAPDMVIGLNAGLHAYDSWRHVVSYLYHNPNVVGVFTDYNEHSGMNCASLGGGRARNSLEINPFRQPRAMPVNCMNLPQMSNGFMYVFNEHELE